MLKYLKQNQMEFFVITSLLYSSANQITVTE